MATDKEFESAQKTGKTHDFVPKTKNGTNLRGVVKGRADSVLTTADAGAARSWKIEDERGNSYEIPGEDYDIV